MSRRRCAYCKEKVEPGDFWKDHWCSFTCYRADRDRYLEDKADGERDERRMHESRPN